VWRYGTSRHTLALSDRRKPMPNRGWWEYPPDHPERARLKALHDTPTREPPKNILHPRKHRKVGNSWVGAQKCEFNPKDRASERWAFYCSMQTERLDNVTPTFIEGMLVLIADGLRYGVPHGSRPAEIAQLVFSLKTFRANRAAREKE
jgi:hypothetical protein